MAFLHAVYVPQSVVLPWGNFAVQQMADFVEPFESTAVFSLATRFFVSH